MKSVLGEVKDQPLERVRIPVASGTEYDIQCLIWFEVCEKVRENGTHDAWVQVRLGVWNKTK